MCVTSNTCHLLFGYCVCGSRLSLLLLITERCPGAQKAQWEWLRICDHAASLLKRRKFTTRINSNTRSIHSARVGVSRIDEYFLIFYLRSARARFDRSQRRQFHKLLTSRRVSGRWHRIIFIAICKLNNSINGTALAHALGRIVSYC